MVGEVGGGVGAACSLALILALAVLGGRGGWPTRWPAIGCASRGRPTSSATSTSSTEIRTKAAEAAATDYAGLPQPLFDLLTTLTEKLGPLIDLGGPIGLIVDRIRRALNHSPRCTPPESRPLPCPGRGDDHNRAA